MNLNDPQRSVRRTTLRVSRLAGGRTRRLIDAAMGERRQAADRGVAAIMAMMFLVIFGSLAAAMAVVASGNLRTAEASLKINRSLAAAETGLSFADFRLQLISEANPLNLEAGEPGFDLYPGLTIQENQIDAAFAATAWASGVTNDDGSLVEPVVGLLQDLFSEDLHNLRDVEVRTVDGQANVLVVGPIKLRPGADEPDFVISFRPHPVPGLDYDQPAYNSIDFREATGLEDEVSNANPLDARFIQVRVTAMDDGSGTSTQLGETEFANGVETATGNASRTQRYSQVFRSVTVDYMMTRRNPYAFATLSRMMIGQNVHIDGPILTAFTETGVPNGHPLEVQSDFLGLDPDLDYELHGRTQPFLNMTPDDASAANLRLRGAEDDPGFYDFVAEFDISGDNRLSVNSFKEMGGYLQKAGLTQPPTSWSESERQQFRDLQDDLDYDGDGFLTDFDFFLKHFDGSGSAGIRDGFVDADELDINGSDELAPARRELFELINDFISPGRELTEEDDRFSYQGVDARIGPDDFYTKINGRVDIVANRDDWEAENGLLDDLDGRYQQVVNGPINPDFGDAPINFDVETPEMTPDTFDTAAYTERGGTPEPIAAQAVNAEPYPANATPVVQPAPAYPAFNAPAAARQAYLDSLEPVPYGASNPYDYYARPVYRNILFRNAVIPAGSNAKFVNCKFEGITIVRFETANATPQGVENNFNYAGMQTASGAAKHVDRTFDLDGDPNTLDDVYGGDPDDPLNPPADEQERQRRALGTKLLGNNLHFQDCLFTGPIVSSGRRIGAGIPLQPAEFTHVRNKITFTGSTQFDFEDAVADNSEEDKELFYNSSLMLPHVSVEMGIFNTEDSTTSVESASPLGTPTDVVVEGVEGNTAANPIQLSGMIVAGLIDLRGYVDIEGGIVSTFNPVSNQGPVRGDTSADFNTTLGYFSNEQGDREAQALRAGTGRGRIRIRHNDQLIPPGLPGPLLFKRLPMTRMEGGGDGRILFTSTSGGAGGS